LGHEDFLYRAASGSKARRVVAKVKFHAGELFPRVGFIVTKPGAAELGRWGASTISGARRTRKNEPSEHR
jgi:hypothetical protein